MLLMSFSDGTHTDSWILWLKMTMYGTMLVFYGIALENDTIEAWFTFAFEAEILGILVCWGWCLAKMNGIKCGSRIAVDINFIGIKCH